MRVKKRLLTFIFTIFLTPGSAPAQTLLPSDKNTPDLLNPPDRLPWNVFPSFRKFQGLQAEQDEDLSPNLATEMENLGDHLGDTVRSIAERRNFICLRRPCLVQAFPILYTKQNAGFFGGFRANVRDSLRPRHPYYSLTTQIIHSDTDQWLTFLALDFPRIEKLPTHPRLRIKGTYNKSNEARYFGSGLASKGASQLEDDYLRYGMQERNFQSSLFIPAWEKPHENKSFNIFSIYSFTNLDTYIYDQSEGSKLFNDRPAGYRGEKISRMSLGLIYDSRDQSVNTRRGFATELTVEFPGRYGKEYQYQRYTFVDRRYLSWGKNSFAFRATADIVRGTAPFWALESIGGSDPIRNVGGSGVMRAYPAGRIQERDKFIESVEYRHFLSPRRVLGTYAQITWPVLGFDVGRQGPLNTYDAFAGTDFLFNKTFLVRTYVGYAQTGWAWTLRFDQEF